MRRRLATTCGLAAGDDATAGDGVQASCGGVRASCGGGGDVLAAGSGEMASGVGGL
jgi:hypothetical protein